MINVQEKNEQYYSKSQYMSNFYTNFLTNNWDLYKKEYKQNFMYRVVDQIKILVCFYFSRL